MEDPSRPPQEGLRRSPGRAAAQLAPYLFIALTVLPSVALVLCARWFGWTAEVSGALRLPLVFSPLLASLALTAWAEGPAATGRLWGRFFVLPRRRWTLVAAVCVFPALALVALSLRAWIYGIGIEPRQDLSVPGVLGMSLFLFLFPGMTEELGWRGFLQPRLTARVGPFIASLGVGLTWGLWHGFDLATKSDSYALEIYPWFLLMTVAAALVLGWLGERNGHSVPAAMLGHFGVNAVFSFFPMAAEEAEGLIWRLFALVTLGFALLLFALSKSAGNRAR